MTGDLEKQNTDTHTHPQGDHPVKWRQRSGWWSRSQGALKIVGKPPEAGSQPNTDYPSQPHGPRKRHLDLDQLRFRCCNSWPPTGQQSARGLAKQHNRGNLGSSLTLWGKAVHHLRLPIYLLFKTLCFGVSLKHKLFFFLLPWKDALIERNISLTCILTNITR